MDYFSGVNFVFGGLRPKHMRWHRHLPTYYGVQYNHSGSLRLRVKGGADVVFDGPCAFISHPKAFIEYGTDDGNPRSHNFICFFGPRVEDFIRGGLLNISTEKPLVMINRPQRFLQTMSELVCGLGGRADGQPSSARMILLLEDLLLMMSESKAGMEKEKTIQEDGLLEFISAVENNPERDWDFTREARRRCITTEHFRRLFKDLAGNPPQRYLINLRLRMAAEMLATGDLPISEIAERTGIGRDYYFSRLFKDRFAVSPLRYRMEFAAHPHPLSRC